MLEYFLYEITKLWVLILDFNQTFNVVLSGALLVLCIYIILNEVTEINDFPQLFGHVSFYDFVHLFVFTVEF